MPEAVLVLLAAGAATVSLRIPDAPAMAGTSVTSTSALDLMLGDF